MSPRQQWIWASALGLHLLTIATVALLDISASLSVAPNLLPDSFRPVLARTAAGATAALGRDLPEANPFRQLLALYANSAGIELGYSYFAPNVPGNARLAFELYYPDGRIENDVPAVSGESAGYRLATLLDYLQGVHYRRLREALLTRLVRSIHREHPRATKIRAILSAAGLTDAAEYRAGKRISYQTSFAYDYYFRPAKADAVTP